MNIQPDKARSYTLIAATVFVFLWTAFFAIASRGFSTLQFPRGWIVYLVGIVLFFAVPFIITEAAIYLNEKKERFTEYVKSILRDRKVATEIYKCAILTIIAIAGILVCVKLY